MTNTPPSASATNPPAPTDTPVSVPPRKKGAKNPNRRIAPLKQRMPVRNYNGEYAVVFLFHPATTLAHEMRFKELACFMYRHCMAKEQRKKEAAAALAATPALAAVNQTTHTAHTEEHRHVG